MLPEVVSLRFLIERSVSFEGLANIRFLVERVTIVLIEDSRARDLVVDLVEVPAGPSLDLSMLPIVAKTLSLYVLLLCALSGTSEGSPPLCKKSKNYCICLLTVEQSLVD